MWGKINLTSYDGDKDFPKGQPLVYDVEVSMQGETEGPTASMKWDPTGKGFAVYESFLASPELMGTQIVIDFFYAGGKRIPMKFVWTGQSIAYGNDMTVTVKMQSELAGLVNANIRNIAQVDNSPTGFNGVQSIDYVKRQFALGDYKNLVKYNDAALKSLQKAKLESNYATDTTFGAQISNIAQQTGNIAYANSIEEANIVLMGPFSIDKDAVVLNGVTEIPKNASPDPTKRYGYLLGPSMITTITRSVEWKSPQQTNQNTPSTQVKANPPASQTGSNTQRAPSQPQRSTTTTSAPTQAVSGTSNGRSTPGIANKRNPDQVARQNALNAEKVAQLTMNTYLVPALVGVKPHDILYIPSLKGDFIEDWIIQSVDYNQNDGNIEVGIQATRVYGQGAPMNQKQADKFLGFAKQNGMVGPNWTLEAWEKYAWMTDILSAPQGATA